MTSENIYFFLMFTCNKLAEIFFQSTKKNIFILIYILFEIKSFLLNYFIIDIIILTLHTVIYNIILQLNIHARVCIYSCMLVFLWFFFVLSFILVRHGYPLFNYYLLFNKKIINIYLKYVYILNDKIINIINMCVLAISILRYIYIYIPYCI
jgi:hypothetical protein